MIRITPRALRIVEWDFAVYRRAWRGTITINFLGPILFLTSIGVGLGTLVNRGGGLGMSYLAFLAPALLAANAMQAGMSEATYPVMGKLKWERTYDAVIATPATVTDVVFGELGWFAIRQLLVATAFTIVLALFQVPRSPLAVLAVPAAALNGLAFAMPIYAYTTTLDNDVPFAMLFRLGMGPLFLFSGTFFPIDRLPPLVEGLAWALPLSHGVALCRDLVLSTPRAVDLVHVGVLTAYLTAGVGLARAGLRRRLQK